MDDTVISALISGLAVAIPSIIATVATINRSNVLQDERISRIQDDIEKLSDRVDKHNTLIERVGVLEAEVSNLKNN